MPEHSQAQVSVFHVPLEFVHFVAAAVSAQSQEVPLQTLFDAQEQEHCVSSHVPPELVQTEESAALVHWHPVAADQLFLPPQEQEQSSLFQTPSVDEQREDSFASQVLLTQQVPSSVKETEESLSCPSGHVEGQAVFATQQAPSSLYSTAVSLF